MKTPSNKTLFAARVAKGWFSQESAAEGVSDAGKVALSDSGYEVSVRTYRRWESAAPGWPRPDQATALRAAFGRGPEHLGEARVYYSEALNTATISGDYPLATRTLSNMARQSVDVDKPREAVRFARTAQQYAAKWDAPPRVAALLAIRAAQAYARGGDEMNVSHSIKRAWRSFDQGTDHGDPDWVGFLNEAELVCLEGMCWSDLGQHKRAIRLLDRSASLQDIEHSRNRGMCLAQLARAAVHHRDLDRTADAAKESLRLIEGGQPSARTRRQLLNVRESLHPHQSSAQARETIDLLTAHVA
ncbi:hypothetical protein ACFVW2_19865 [Streptomyces sp. NPDC058171]